MGRSFANLAPNKESHPIHPTQELPGSALSDEFGDWVGAVNKAKFGQDAFIGFYQFPDLLRIERESSQ
jgi:hypothetical protein